MAGKRGGHSAIVLSYSAITAALFDFVGPSMRAWAENFSTGAIGVLSEFTNKYKAVFTMNTSAAVLGLGYIMGLEYAAIILAGSFVSFLRAGAAVRISGPVYSGRIAAGALPLAQMPAEDIFFNYVRPIGIGGIFAAGILSILKMSPVIVQATRQAIGEIVRLVQKKGAGTAVDRTDRALPMSLVLLGIAATGVLVFLYFRFSVLAGMSSATNLALISVLLTLVISFLFAAVSAWAIAMISITPISGMTLTTLIVTAVALSSLGLRGESGMLQVLLIGGVVCTALSMSGSLVTQYKIGYWLGATPRRIEISNMIGSIVSIRLDDCRHSPHVESLRFRSGAGPPESVARPAAERDGRRAPRRNGRGGSSVVSVWLGAVFAVVVAMCGISALAFALGMYLPMELNSPLVLGAAIAWFLQRSSKNQALNKARHEKGTLIASGFIAGGALVGVLAALLRFIEDSWNVPIVPDLVKTLRAVAAAVAQLARLDHVSAAVAGSLLGRLSGESGLIGREPASVTFEYVPSRPLRMP